MSEVYQEIRSLVEKHLRELGIKYEFIDKYEIEMEDSSSIRSEMNIQNLIRYCLEYYENKEELVKEFIDNLLESFRNSIEKTEEKKIFDLNKEYIGIRFIHEDYFPEELWNESIKFLKIGDIWLILFLDQEKYTRTITEDEAKYWKKSKAELFEIGYENMLKKYQYTTELVDIQNIPVYVIDQEHYFGSLILLELCERNNLMGKYGSVMAVPNMHETFIYPIENKGIKNVTDCFLRLAVFRYEKPRPFTRNLFWYYNEKFHVLQVEKIENAINFFPSRDFSDLLL